MKKKNILITGASGMLGSAMLKKFSSHFNAFGTGLEDLYLKNLNYLPFDLTNDKYYDLINWSKPDIIIHCGALTDVNLCEENPKNTFEINSFSTLKFIQQTNPSVRIIFISSDAVFEPNLKSANENDNTNPINIYGKSKELSEFFLKNSNKNFLIIRTTILGFNLNKNRQSFIEWIINSSIENKEIGLFNDVYFNPISIYDLITEIYYLIKNEEINSKILHINGSEVTTKYEFGIKLLKFMNLRTNLVKIAFLKNFNKRANRNFDQTLSVLKYQKEYKRLLPNIDETISSLKKNEK